MSDSDKIPVPESPLPGTTSEEWFRTIVESAPSGIIVTDENGRVVMSNERACQLFGYSRQEFEQISIEKLVPQRMRGVHSGYRQDYQAHAEVRAMGAGRDLYAVRKDGTEFPVEIGLTPLSIPSHRLFLSSILDISERKQAEDDLRHSNEKMRFQAEILRNVHDAVFFVNEDGIVLDWNDGAARTFHISAKEAVGAPLDELCPSPGAPPFERLKKSISTTGESDEMKRCQLRSGREIFVRARVRKASLEGQDGYVVCASDITERKKLENELLKIAEDEQRKIGQDIHDDLCSQLSGIGCLTKVLEQQFSENHQQEAELMTQINEMVASAGLKAREIAKGLVPSILETQGLSSAIRDLAERNRKLYKVNCFAKLKDTGFLDSIEKATAVQVYRIVQEAISNAIRHSDADSIEINLSNGTGRLELEVSDDGKGISIDMVSAGMGLLTMQRRAELIQADFDIHTSPGKGTSIRCSIPVLEE